MTTYAIMQEPGARAAKRREKIAREFAVSTYSRPKRVGTVQADSQREALRSFVQARYFAADGTQTNRQYAGQRIEWQGRIGGTWRPDDGETTRGRQWRIVVRLRNGRNEHESVFLAWQWSR